MVFNSLTFIFIFFPITVLVYFVARSRAQKNLILLISSLFFYSWGEPNYIFLMIITIMSNYVFAIVIEKNLLCSKNSVAKFILVIAIVANLAVLGYFKYYDLAITTINSIFNSTLSIKQLPLPIGISFYTFQTLSYTIDVYRKEVKAQKNIITLGTYVALFPQLIAGPIVRYSTIEKELTTRTNSFNNVYVGFKRFTIGLAKKVIIANNAAVIAKVLFETDSSVVGSSGIWVGLIAFAIQIYFDFSGYSDMAIGLGRMFGFHFLENFNYPYISKSITEFWRRWHISLSTWFRDYLYIPLGGNRVGKVRWYVNVFIVWFATGLWHGADYNFILWGLYFAIILVIEKAFMLNILSKLPKVFRHIYALIFILIGWLIFNNTDISILIMNFKTLFNFSSTNWEYIISVSNNFFLNSLIIIIAIIGATPLIKNLFVKIKTTNLNLLLLDIGVIILFTLCIATIIGSEFSPFIYFRF